MAKQTNIYHPVGATAGAAQFANADGTTIKDVLAAGAEDTLLKNLVITSSDTAGRDVQLYLYDGTTNYPVDAIAVPAGSGTNGTAAAVDGLTGAWLSLDSSGKKSFLLKAGWKLRAAMLVAVTAATTVTVLASGEDF